MGDEEEEEGNGEVEVEEREDEGVRSPAAPEPPRGNELADEETAPALAEREIDLTEVRGRPRTRSVPPFASEPGGAWAGADTDEIATQLAALGQQIRMRVTRVGPQDHPECGAADAWLTPPGAPTTTADDIERAVRTKYGGGEYVVELQGGSLSDITNRRRVRIAILGDPIPQTTHGRLWSAARGLGLPTSTVAGTGGVDPSAAQYSNVTAVAMSMLQRQAEQQQAAAERKESREMSFAAEMAKAMTPLRSGPNLAEVVGALAPVAMAWLQSQQQQAQAAREQASRDAQAAIERQERFFQQLLAMQKPQTPVEMATVIQSAVSLMQKSAEMTMARNAEVNAEVTKTAIQMAKKSGASEEEVGALEMLGRSLAKGIGDKAPEMLSSFANWMAASTRAAVRQQAPARAFASPAQPALPAPAQGPATAPPQEGEIEGAPPVQGAEAAAAGPDEATGEEQGGQPPSSEQVAQFMSVRALMQWLTYVEFGLHNLTEPSMAWEFRHDGQTIAVWYALMPYPVRMAVEATAQSEDAEVAATTGWVAGVSEPAIASVVERIDALLEQDEIRRKWLRAFLDAGPLGHEDEDED